VEAETVSHPIGLDRSEMNKPSFKDENRAMQELVRELGLIRAHNLGFKEGDPHDRLLLFAEAALTCLTMERNRSGPS
jgi:hypothetical protein